MRTSLARLAVVLVCLLFGFRLVSGQTLQKVRETDGTVYYVGYEFQKFQEYKGRDVSRASLLGLVTQAYENMKSMWKVENQGKDDSKKSKLPAIMEAFWVPDDGHMYFASSTVYGKGDWGYKSSNPQQVLNLLAATQASVEAEGKPKTQHRVGGSCAEVVAAVLYFRQWTTRPARPAPTKSKMIAYGDPYGAGAAQQNACTGRQDVWGCEEFLKTWGVLWYGINGKGTAQKRSLELRQDDSNDEYVCVVDDTAFTANPTFTPTTFQTALATSIYSPTGSASAIGETSSSATSTLASAPTPTATDPVDAGSIIHDHDKESQDCIQECLAGFKSCTKINNESGNTGDVNVMDCAAVAKCYNVDVPYSGDAALPGNPEDPNAPTGPSAAGKIDMNKASDECNQVRPFL